MMKDAQGLDVSTVSMEAVAELNRYTEYCLSYDHRAESAILAAIAADPSSVLAHTHAAAYYFSQESADTWQQGIAYLNIAKKEIESANEREKRYFLATEAWAFKEIDLAVSYCDQIVEAFPQDIFAVQRSQYHYFYSGDKHNLVNVGEKALSSHADNHYLLGMLAFGLEQCRFLASAEKIARQAVEMSLETGNPDPWAVHAVAHVMETQNRHEEGIHYLESLSHTWENCNSMLYTHNYWHIALFYLAKGNIRKVLSLYDRQVWGKAQKESPKDQVGAISLLLRLELLGINVGDRWEKVSAYLRPRLHEHALPFQDLHYIYALARAGKRMLAQEMLESMEDYANNIKPTLSRAWTEIALPAAKGAIAHANGDWKTTEKLFKPILPNLYKIGGSHAQRDLFQKIYADACQKGLERTTPIYSFTKRQSQVIHSYPKAIALS
jgi:hypothetical protein